MNKTLVPYGIQNEGSDYRAHVSPTARAVFIYRTKAGIDAINSGKYVNKPAKQGGITTARGYPVPWKDIKGIKRVGIPESIWKKANIQKDDGLGAKGAKAVKVVCWMLNNGLFPLSASHEVVEEAEMQIKGLDIIVKMRARIQVKCDYATGETGNLYLQVSECNPFGIY